MTVFDCLLDKTGCQRCLRRRRAAARCLV